MVHDKLGNFLGTEECSNSIAWAETKLQPKLCCKDVEEDFVALRTEFVQRYNDIGSKVSSIQDHELVLCLCLNELVKTRK